MAKSMNMTEIIINTTFKTMKDIYQTYKQKKSYSYKSAPMNYSEYEKNILLNEEDDDENYNGAFDYNETIKIPKILTSEEIL